MSRHSKGSVHLKVRTSCPEVAVWRGMGQRPMQRSGTDPEFSASRPRGVLDAAAAVRLPPLPIRDLINSPRIPRGWSQRPSLRRGADPE